MVGLSKSKRCRVLLQRSVCVCMCTAAAAAAAAADDDDVASTTNDDDLSYVYHIG